jgi:hypothetical protein
MWIILETEDCTLRIHPTKVGAVHDGAEELTQFLELGLASYGTFANIDMVRIHSTCLLWISI